MVKYDLYYLNCRCRAEITRLLFHVAGVEFNDHRYELEDFEKLKAESPLGACPWLEVDGVKLPQSIAAARYVARELNLDGKTSLEKAQADVIVDTCLDMFNTILKLLILPEGGDKVIKNNYLKIRIPFSKFNVKG
jgi:hypothetical protein